MKQNIFTIQEFDLNDLNAKNKHPLNMPNPQKATKCKPIQYHYRLFGSTMPFSPPTSFLKWLLSVGMRWDEPHGILTIGTIALVLRLDRATFLVPNSGMTVSQSRKHGEHISTTIVNCPLEQRKRGLLMARRAVHGRLPARNSAGVGIRKQLPDCTAASGRGPPRHDLAPFPILTNHHRPVTRSVRATAHRGMRYLAVARHDPPPPRAGGTRRCTTHPGPDAKRRGSP